MDHLLTNFVSSQLYLALYLGLIPINETVQTEIVPVVRAPPFFLAIHAHKLRILSDCFSSPSTPSLSSHASSVPDSDI